MQPGQKVTLIDDAWPDTVRLLYASLPIKGPAYVVRAVRPGQSVDALVMDYRKQAEDSITLIGVHNPSDKFGEWGFAARRFRTIEELRETNRQTQEAFA